MGIGDGPLRRAVFLDRDGIVTEPVPDPAVGAYESPYRPQDVALVGDVAAALRTLRDEGFLLVGVSNQPAAAKGTVSLATLRAVHDRAVALLADEGLVLDGWRYCFHHPRGVVEGLSARCDCRKPAPGMLIASAGELGIDLAASWMVGDSDSDVLAGRAAGTRTALVEHPRTAHRRRGAVQPTVRAPDNMLATQRIAQYGAPRHERTKVRHEEGGRRDAGVDSDEDLRGRR